MSNKRNRSNELEEGTNRNSTPLVNPEKKILSPEIPRSVKRKLNHHDDNRKMNDNYLPGSIMHIRCKNFMTYDNFQLTPSSRLNVIIGPNGTGKSSLVCAIGLGLGGEPKLLGRAKNISDFVQNGKEEGAIEITVRGNSPSITHKIIRKIFNTSKSEWILDGKPVKKEEVTNLTSKLNIQVSNLTQFLPQDRVCEFAKLSAEDLLTETEKAISDEDNGLHSQHLSLINQADAFKQLQTSVSSHGSMIESLKGENAELEQDVQRMEKRNQILEEVSEMKKKEPWLLYDKLKSEYLEKKELLKIKKEEFDKIKLKFNRKTAPIENAQIDKDKILSQRKNIDDDINVMENQKQSIEKEEEHLSNDLICKYQEMNDVEIRCQQMQARVDKATAEIAELETQLQNLQNLPNPSEDLKGMNEAISMLINNSSEIERQKRLFESQTQRKQEELNEKKNRLTEIDNMRMRVIQALQKNGERKIFDIIDWINEKKNQNVFKGPVFGPIAAEIRIANEMHAKFLEQHVPFWVWKAFVVTNSEDRDMLMTNLGDYHITVINESGGSDFIVNSSEITDQMRGLGIEYTLDQVFDCHPIIKKVLCVQGMIHKSFIGSDSADRNAKEFPNMGISDLWTPNNHYRWSNSRYSKTIIAMVHDVRNCRIFVTGGSVQERHDLMLKNSQLENEILNFENIIKECSQKLRKIEDEESNLQKQKDALTQKYRENKKKIDYFNNKILDKRNVLKSFLNFESPEITKKRIQNQIFSIMSKRKENLKSLNTILMNISEKCFELAKLFLMQNEIDTKIELAKDLIRREESILTEAEGEFNKIDDECKQARERLKNAKDRAMEVCDIVNNPQLQHKFKQFPGTMEELRERIEEKTNEANAILCNNPHILAEYQKKQKKILELERKFALESDKLQNFQKEMDRTMKNWLVNLRKLVSKVNKYFSKSFSKMAVAGEVALDEHGNDFEKYGIMIKVQFRENAPLEFLSAQHQSGGERSVATIIYLLSLQKLTHCPFRVIDEINQGMDTNNERKMFERMVSSYSNPNTPQCFLLTPKLLPNLKYGKRTSLITIFNGELLHEDFFSVFSKTAGSLYHGVVSLV